MSEKRKRQATVVCTDEVWSEFQALASQRGKTLAVLLGEVVADEVSLGARGDQGTLPVVGNERTGQVPAALPPRMLIGFGQPVVRIR